MTGRALLPAGRSEWLFAAAGLALVVAQVVVIVTTRGLDHTTATSFAAVAPLILGLALPGLALIAAGPRLVAVAPSPFVLVALVVCGLAMRLLWFGTVPPLEDDYNRYLWDGAVTASCLDPYAHPPELFASGDGAAPEAYRRIAAAGESVLASINFPHMRSIYPSVAQAAFAAAHVIAPFKVDGLRLVFLAAEIATLVLLLGLLRGLGLSPLWALAYWWNPLMAAMLIGLVHLDALLVPFVLGAVLAMSRARPMLALILLGLGAGVKIWPLLLAPLALWPLLREPRRLIAANAVLAVVLAVALGPVVLSALQPGSGLSAYAGGWMNNNAFYAWALYLLSELTGSREIARLLLRSALALAVVAVALVLAVRGDCTMRSLCRRALAITAVLFYLSPAQFPWYAAWFLPLAALAQSWPLLLASATLPVYYTFFPLWPDNYGVRFFYGAAFFHSAPVLGWLAWQHYMRVLPHHARALKGP